MKYLSLTMALGVAMLCGSTAEAQVSVAKEKRGQQNEPVPRSQPEAQPEKTTAEDERGDEKEDGPRPEARPRNPEESSSRDTIIDLRPPKNDSKRRPREDFEIEEATGVNEMKPWNPHKAAKAIEVGEYYFKDKNYKAAISRYREALEYKPRDAHATYRLGEVLERTGQKEEALQRYEEYLKILKNGPFAEASKRGIDRLRNAGPSIGW